MGLLRPVYPPRSRRVGETPSLWCTTFARCVIRRLFEDIDTLIEFLAYQVVFLRIEDIDHAGSGNNVSVDTRI